VSVFFFSSVLASSLVQDANRSQEYCWCVHTVLQRDGEVGVLDRGILSLGMFRLYDGLNKCTILQHLFRP
jgi:hypothetical protein